MLSTRLFSIHNGIFSQRGAELWDLMACKSFPGKPNRRNIWKRFQILAKKSPKVKYFYKANPKGSPRKIGFALGF
jgi:hypothetical protein